MKNKLLLLSILAMAWLAGCGAPPIVVPTKPTKSATTVTPTAASATATVTLTATPVRPTATASPTLAAPTVTPTTVPPTLKSVAQATATKPRVVASRTPTIPAPTPTPKYPVPAGKGGLLVRNFYGTTLNYTVANQELKVPANSEMFLLLAPGKYPASANIAGQLEDWEMLEITVDEVIVSTWY